MNNSNLKLKAIHKIEEYFDNGFFLKHEKSSELYKYFQENLIPYLSEIGFKCKISQNPEKKSHPILIAIRIESINLPTIFSYGHADVVPGYEDSWISGLSPWKIVEKENKIYGRGTADNKGQHTINLAALKTVLQTRGYLGFNIKILIETGEEIGSPGLEKFCEENAKSLSSDFLLASDGPRINPEKPSIYLGSRGEISFKLVLGDLNYLNSSSDFW